MGGAQVLPDQPGSTTSPNVQEADECVAGATVPLDELTVQPDFSYDDSGSDTQDQLTPQRSE